MAKRKRGRRYGTVDDGIGRSIWSGKLTRKQKVYAACRKKHPRSLWLRNRCVKRREKILKTRLARNAGDW